MKNLKRRGKIDIDLRNSFKSSVVRINNVIFYQILEGPTCMAGYSLGEITACVCAGVLSFTDG